jgi:hypothetical protein
MFIVDPQGTLVFYNEPAEGILGCRYEETGPMPTNEWVAIFSPTDEQGSPLPLEQLPLIKALEEGLPNHGGFWARGSDGHRRYLEVTAFPLVGQANRKLGGIAILWESSR